MLKGLFARNFLENMAVFGYYMNVMEGIQEAESTNRSIPMDFS